MERGNTKHGPAHDQEMAHETEGMVRGSAHRAHGEEWRETEPAEGAVPPLRRGDGANPRPEGRDIELRSEFARVMTKDCFPADKDAIAARLQDADAPPDLAERVAALPAATASAARTTSWRRWGSARRKLIDRKQGNLVKMGNCNHRAYVPGLLSKIAACSADPATVWTQEETIPTALQAYEAFDRRGPGWTKVTLEVG